MANIKNPDKKKKQMHTWFYLVLAAFPFAFLVFMVAKFGIDMPFWDEWDLVPLIEKTFQGDLGFGDLRWLLNEHRPFFPLVIITFLARLTHWNIRFELAANILLSLGFFLLLIRQIRRIEGTTFWISRGWVIPIISLIVFSMSQEENWYMGICMIFIMNIAAVTAGFFLLCRPELTWKGFSFALLLGAVALYTSVNGILYWLIGGCLILLLPTKNRIPNKKRFIFWCISGLFFIISYFFRFQWTDHHPRSWAFFSQPLEFSDYVLSYLGAPLFAFGRKLTEIPFFNSLFFLKEGAVILGFAGVCLWSFLIWYLIKKRGRNLRELLPFLTLGIYSLFSAAMTAVGRIGIEGPNALSSRYIATSSLFWISLVVLLAMVYARTGPPHKTETHKRMRKMATASLVIIVVFLVLNAGFGSFNGVYRHIRQMGARNELLGLSDNSFLDRYTPFIRLLPATSRAELFTEDRETLLKRLYPYRDILIPSITTIKKYKLSLFRDKKE